MRRARTHPRRPAKLEQKPGWRGPQTGIDRQHVVPVLAPARVGRADRGAQSASGGARTVPVRIDTQKRTGWSNTHMEAGVQLCCRHVLCRAWVHAGVRTRRRGSRRCHSAVALPSALLHRAGERIAALPKMEVEPTRRRRSARPKVTEKPHESQFHLDLSTVSVSCPALPLA